MNLIWSSVCFNHINHQETIYSKKVFILSRWTSCYPNDGKAAMLFLKLFRISDEEFLLFIVFVKLRILQRFSETFRCSISYTAWKKNHSAFQKVFVIVLAQGVWNVPVWKWSAPSQEEASLIWAEPGGNRRRLALLLVWTLGSSSASWMCPNGFC